LDVEQTSVGLKADATKRGQIAQIQSIPIEV
jgi:hypothetical protein